MPQIQTILSLSNNYAHYSTKPWHQWSMVLDLVDGVLPIVLVDAKGPCQPASSLPSNTSQAFLHVRDGGQGPNNRFCVFLQKLCL